MLGLPEILLPTRYHKKSPPGTMKKFLLVGSIAVVTFVCGVVVGHFQLPPFQIMRIAKQQLRLEQALEPWLGTFRRPEDQIDVIMLGDSITAQGEWAELFPRAKILNLGLGSDTSAGLLNRLRDVIDRDPPPLKWSDLRYVFDIQEDCNGKEAIQA